MSFSHLDAEHRPTMVDVSDKTASKRTALAEAAWLSPAVAAALRESGLRSPKGPVFDTAIVAGVMGAKRTHELIPFCHPLGSRAAASHRLEGDTAVIRCTVSVHHKTGVEMEALTGASIAALTIYDMCKALSHDIVIGECAAAQQGRRQERFRVRRRRHERPARAVQGLMLAGGTSSRMQRDKAALTLPGQEPARRAFELASRHVATGVRVGARQPGRRPGAGALSADRRFGSGRRAHRRHPLGARRPSPALRGSWWPATCRSCPMPCSSSCSASAMPRIARRPRIAARTTACPSRCARSWEPQAAARSPRIRPRRSMSAQVPDAPARKSLEPFDPRALDNVNTPEEYRAASSALEPPPCPPMQLKFSITP
jgi:cyclic pyranopterin monophosphate synthase